MHVCVCVSKMNIHKLTYLIDRFHLKMVRENQPLLKTKTKLVKIVC